MSILNKRKYGDFDNVSKDAKTLHDIIDRQGPSLVIDAIAEKIGAVSNKYKLKNTERKHILDSLIIELTTAILERV